MKHVIEMIKQGFNNRLKPKLTDEGTSGTYEMRDVLK
jgi:cAMP phosphodiesterase